MKFVQLLFISAVLSVFSFSSMADAPENKPKKPALLVAVASNFGAAIVPIAREFEKETEQPIKVLMGATGKHFAQIQHGAPFDLFLAADVKRPRLLEQQGKVQDNGRATYAIGRLVLVRSTPLTYNFGDHPTPEMLLKDQSFFKFAVANPRLAPYGRAAQNYLQSLSLFHVIRPRMVMGENIGQTYQFIKSGNADMGLVSMSQVISDLGVELQGIKWWLIDETTYNPIEQQMVLLSDKKEARQFFDYLRTEKAKEHIERFGYKYPE